MLIHGEKNPEVQCIFGVASGNFLNIVCVENFQTNTAGKQIKQKKKLTKTDLTGAKETSIFKTMFNLKKG